MFELISLSSGFLLWAASCWLLYAVGYQAGVRAGVIKEIRRRFDIATEEFNGR